MYDSMCDDLSNFAAGNLTLTTEHGSFVIKSDIGDATFIKYDDVYFAYNNNGSRYVCRDTVYNVNTEDATITFVCASEILVKDIVFFGRINC